MVCRMLVTGFHNKDGDDDRDDDDYVEPNLYLHEACEKGWQPLKVCCMPLGIVASTKDWYLAYHV